MILTRFTVTSTIIPAQVGSVYTVPVASFANPGALLVGMVIAFTDSACHLTFARVGNFLNGMVPLTTLYTQPGFNGQVLAGTPVYLFGF